MNARDGARVLNQLFIFKKLGVLPRIFSDLSFGYNIKNIDETIIEFSSKKFGKNIVFNIPLDMIDCEKLIRSFYPYDVTIGLVDDINKIDEEILDRIAQFNFMVVYSERLTDVIMSRNILRKLMGIKPDLKKIIVLDVDPNIVREDLELYIEMSRIYNYKPAILVKNRNTLEHVKHVLGLRDARHCVTKWFNYEVIIYSWHRSEGPIIILVPSDKPDVEVMVFRDCIAFLCHAQGQLSVSSIIRFIYENAKPVLFVDDVLIDEDFIAVMEHLSEYKSIRATSKSMGIPYSRIRRIIKEVEKLERVLGVQLIEAKRGGSDYGKTSFTHVGKIVIDNIKELYGELVKAYSSIIMNTFEELRKDKDRPICVFPLSV